MGYTPKGSRSGFGSLLLARPDPEAKSGWVYAGRVGTGFSNEELRSLGKSIADKGSPRPTVALAAIDPLLRDARWVGPAAVAEVYYRGVGNHRLLRQPSLKAMRIDKKAADLVDSDRAQGKPAGTPRKRPVADATSTDIRITHPERVLFPDDGITKQQVADYYASVM